MPKWIGNDKRAGVTEFLDGDDLTEFIRVTYTQQMQFEPQDVRVILDDTDKGGPKAFAKRWWRWYVRRSCITPMHSESLRRRAAEGSGGRTGYLACRLFPALKEAAAYGEDWDTPEAKEARDITAALGVSWDFESWSATLDHVRRHGTLGWVWSSDVSGKSVPYVVKCVW